ncbi:oxidoreductase, short-chain dehydrogenase/reductase family protein [Pseudooceanicola batsensis HTCC2597]|uniref:Oxidoreductase, short-chain dehydrogenase/reductase family protein n=1 Tax=Pseudooceanicola batsensis (strain ATCC BAA-863 / DSM 15984 / KCTC 12145 / HTCC2597) TaxID=252305 RepID=A3TZ71_PSEBH|nr:SDR family oxidoreductase [Pseudooceanicola batsensis]EAQ02889.1 oxidoreductase, short-chain dehydrogenase/reductase family protein [Pseudooceanicola batsensis HTCC2597]
MRVVITGASRGIGAALAAAYDERGDTVVGTSRSGGAGLVPLDFDAAPDFAPLRDEVGAGAVDILVCNAGIYPDKGQPLADGYPPEMWSRGLFVNVAGPFLTIQALLPALRRSSAPRIAIVSSAMGSQDRAPGGSYIYRASKAAAVNLARNLARDLAPDSIAVGAYHPGWVRTEMGGAGADIDAATSAGGLVSRIDRLTPETTGVFETWDGQPIPF